MARAPTGASTPPDESEIVQAPPRDLHATSDIRFVMVELGKYEARLGGVEKSLDKLGVTFETAVGKFEKTFDKHIDAITADLKEHREKLQEFERKVAWVKGAAWVFGILMLIVIPLLSAIFAALAAS